MRPIRFRALLDGAATLPVSSRAATCRMQVKREMNKAKASLPGSTALPLSSRPERSGAERSAVCPGLPLFLLPLFLLPLFLRTGAKRNGGICGFFCAVLISSCLLAQSGPWEIENSGSQAGLRGVHAASGGVVWASGTGGTILRSENSGSQWQSCTTPTGGEKLDFRGVWAWDALHAFALSSGPSELSRLYRTGDGCRTWQLVLTNPDTDGFWDGIVFINRQYGLIYGDPTMSAARIAEGHLLVTHDGGATWNKADLPAESFFAASNSSMAAFNQDIWLGTGGGRVLQKTADRPWESIATPLASGNDSSGVFSVGFRDPLHGVAVGGNYRKPEEGEGSAAFSSDGGAHWNAAGKPPHGFRSAVAWSQTLRAWITVGTNGSDISYDDGKSWQWLDSGTWNALSLPWAVGPKGRIGKLGTLPAAARVSR